MSSLQDELNQFLEEVAQLEQVREPEDIEEEFPNFDDLNIIPDNKIDISIIKNIEVVDNFNEFDVLDYKPNYLEHSDKLTKSPAGYYYIIDPDTTYKVLVHINSNEDITYFCDYLGIYKKLKHLTINSKIQGGYRISDQTRAREIFDSFSASSYFDPSINYNIDRDLLLDILSADTINIIKSTLVDFYGEENSDFIIINKANSRNSFISWWTQNISSAIKYLVIVKYPEIRITNRDFYITKKFHTIKDLYAIIPLNSNFKGTGHLGGFRGSLTSSEIFSNYRHSHAQRQENTKNNPFIFCIGGPDNPIYDNIRKLSLSGFSNDLFVETLLSLDSHVAYESLEGTPYIKFKEISSYKMEVFDQNIVFAHNKQNILNVTNENIDLKITNGNIIVQESSDFVNKLKYHYPDMLAYKVGDIYYKSSSNSNQSRVNSMNIYFKEEEIPFKLIEEDKGLSEPELHPAFKQYAMDVVNNKIKNILINI